MLSSRPATIISSVLLVVTAGLFVWVAVTAAGGDGSGQQGPSRGATPEPPTPTLTAPRYTARDAAIATLRQEGAGVVLDRALAKDVDGLLGLIPWEQLPCDNPALVFRRCDQSGLAAGTVVPVIQLNTSTAYFDRGYVQAFLAALVGTPDAELVFAARRPGLVGISFAIPRAVEPPVGSGSPLRGIWFDVRPGSTPTIERIYFFTEFSGPRQFYQAFYQPQGGELLYFDQQKAPASAPVTPDNRPPGP